MSAKYVSGLHNEGVRDSGRLSGHLFRSRVKTKESELAGKGTEICQAERMRNTEEDKNAGTLKAGVCRICFENKL